MSKGKLKNISNRSQSNVAPTEPSSPTTARPEHSNTTEAQEENLKTNFMEMTEVFKEEINKSLKEIQENTNKQLEEMGI